MFKLHTKRGLKWELLNSWWVLLSVVSFGIFSFISFFYIGFKVKNGFWKFSGLVYLVAFFIAGTVEQELLGNLSVIIVFASIVHALIARSKFLITLDVFKDAMRNETDRNTKIRQQAQEKFDVKPSDAIASSVKPQEGGTVEASTSMVNELEEIKSPTMKPTIEELPPIMEQRMEENQTPVVKSSLPGMIDINQASELEIATIPRMGSILAKKVVQKREELGGFMCFEEFVKEVNLSESIAKSVEKRLKFSEIKREDKPVTGRMVDL